MKSKINSLIAVLVTVLLAVIPLGACRSRTNENVSETNSTDSLCIASSDTEETADKQTSTANSENTAVPEKAIPSAASSEQNQPSESAAPAQKNETPKSESPSSFKPCSIATSQLGVFRYWLYTPLNPTENMPLIVYLHGGSGKGDDLNTITSADSFPQYLQSGQLGDVRAYVIIPQLPGTKQGWADAAEAVSDLISSAIATYQINRNNISLTGHSMGGTGTWSLACTYPDLFARIAPLSGSIRLNQDTVGKLKNIPIKAFVGSADKIIPPESSEKAVAALKAAGGNADITVFDGADHFSVPGLTFLDKSINLVGWLIGS